MREGEIVSKSEAISTLQEVEEFARRATICFGDLLSRARLMQDIIKHSKDDPINERLLKKIEEVVEDWTKAAMELTL